VRHLSGQTLDLLVQLGVAGVVQLRGRSGSAAIGICRSGKGAPQAVLRFGAKILQKCHAVKNGRLLKFQGPYSHFLFFAIDEWV